MADTPSYCSASLLAILIGGKGKLLLEIGREGGGTGEAAGLGIEAIINPNGTNTGTANAPAGGTTGGNTGGNTEGNTGGDGGDDLGEQN